MRIIVRLFGILTLNGLLLGWGGLAALAALGNGWPVTGLLLIATIVLGQVHLSRRLKRLFSDLRPDIQDEEPAVNSKR